jgi:adenine-specific DNA-methyltransferase
VLFRSSVQHSMLIPYSMTGELLPENDLGDLKDYLNEPERRAKLERRTCVARKRWYAFHENPPLQDILTPKILCKDIAQRPFFRVDRTGEIVPRHSVYYMVPSEASHLDALCEYMNSKEAQTWLMAHCQRAANGFLRLQSHVLKQLPIPAEFAVTPSFADAFIPSMGTTASAT